MSAMRLATVREGAPAQVARVLAREAGHEARVVAQVAPPQPARLAAEPEEPLEAAALHPVRRLRHEAGVEVERRADADEHRRLEPRAHPLHPLLLARHAEADPDDVGPLRVDVG